MTGPDGIPHRSSLPAAYPAFTTTAFDGFAVVDVETTGLSPRGDRVIELAIVHVDPMGEQTGRWETLLNPGRDLGPQRVHGIRAADVLEAPTFADVATELVGLLDGRVAVAHHADFDSAFLFAEFERAGVGVWNRPDFLCTMRLARHFLPGCGRSLGDCCAAYDIPLEHAHRALDDAVATAQLLGAYLGEARRHPQLADPFTGLAGGRWPSAAIGVGRAVPWKARPPAPSVTTVERFLPSLAVRMPPGSEPGDVDEYLALLDRALLDRVLAVHESDALLACAERLHLDRDTVEELHRGYFIALTRVAWEDGILTEGEIDQLIAVAELLALPTAVIEAALDPQRAARIVLQPRRPTAPPGGFALAAGDAVVLTGELSRPRAVWEQELAALGLVPGAAVTRRTALLVAADPDSSSGKARKARQYGVPIVAESGLTALLESLAG
ncbi:exonuclease domain-containing protein [Protaetiibacter intestinalis]|uniref:DNA polymerase III subunit epsilon n=1 Tax=Protaetiibacter intestinalis TaxID=2419774 RepID=A0A387B470_9MICO|nr:exonuclease domain-containing protein [Protaetiibacter intestinalis]AYF97107.1 DNA polymerase III subunit epsilon [Protaetiibacter intestinalis]